MRRGAVARERELAADGVTRAPHYHEVFLFEQRVR
jgi:hypothetical protein